MMLDLMYFFFSFFFFLRMQSLAYYHRNGLRRLLWRNVSLLGISWVALVTLTATLALAEPFNCPATLVRKCGTGSPEKNASSPESLPRDVQGEI